MIENLTLLEKAAMLSGKNIWESRPIPRYGVPSFFMSDGPHGVRKQLGSSDHLGINASQQATCFPTAATVANSWDPVLAELIGEALGEEAASLDVDVLLGPGLNIKRSPLCGRNFEYFSEDPYLAGKMAAGYVRGIQSQGVAATPKHFAVNSQESRRMTTDSVLDERTLREIFLTAFEIVVREAEPRALMTSYNLVNGVYANENAFLLQKVLRDEWGFDGAVITDWGGGNDAVEGARNGSALEMPSPGLDSVRQLVAAVENGALPEAELDARVREVIELGLAFRSPLDPVAPLDVQGHHQLAQRAAEQSIVLLKNDGHLLPLAPGTRVAVIGDFAETPRYQGAGSSLVNPTQLTTTLQAIGTADLKLVDFARGFDRHGAADEELAAEAVLAARSSDVVLLYLGLDEISESEGLDRSDMRMAPNQLALLTRLHAANPNIVVVLSAGSAVEIPWLDDCAALVHGYLAGQAGAAALLNVITGAVNPSGKLAETYPVRHEDTPAFHYFPGTERTAEYREGPYVGYRYYDTANVPVRFPFGFGLSYTEFAYSDLTVTDTAVCFTVKNTGAVDGAEIAQLYIGRNGTGVHRPTKELKGFIKVPLAAGEKRAVTIPLDDKAFRHFDVASGAWQVESAEYTVHVGASLSDIRLTGILAVQGTIAPVAPTVPGPYDTGLITDVSDAHFAALLGHEIPAARWTPGPLGLNDALCQMRDAESVLARLAFRILNRLLRKSEAAHKPDLNLLFLYNMPFRAIAKMTNGAVSLQMVESMLLIVNGHFARGAGALIRGYLHNRRANTQTRKALRAGA
ncbi:glycosyl hydrolase [Cryobacterium lactosi]|uniref:Exo-alpha-(1->6)-L-arabinopyranosidase n=1 Tax=Cryobacterium lactosi TaxID=1259202 RepID=A0A4R9BFX4_9MICO|nr:glycoside hydrolase family 3 C-terminal domain-containing protein [Cryobacterium lactosi]TFD83531.1 glycosyl hydrolase [Cryobacterium lactosi]